jgi:hypothetical protein
MVKGLQFVQDNHPDEIDGATTDFLERITIISRLQNNLDGVICAMSHYFNSMDEIL